MGSGQTVYVTLQQFCEYDDRPRQVLLSAGLTVRENRLGRRLSRDDLKEALRDVDAVLAGVEPYDAELFKALPRLRCISRCGIGTDAIDHVAARAHHVTVLTTPDQVVEPVAQMTVGMMFALARNLPQHMEDFRTGQWRKHTGHLLSEWTIGLIGFGRIGRAVARYLGPFGPRVVATDPWLKPEEFPGGVRPLELNTLLAQSDLVSLHASRGTEEGPLIGRQELVTMKQGSYLVNTARGYLVDETALLEALLAKQLAGVALDVFGREPYTGPLAKMPQVLCTPHVATLTRSSRSAMEMQAAVNVVKYLNGETTK